MTDNVPAGPRSVLVVGSEGQATEQVCMDLLSEAESATTKLLSVTFDKAPDFLVGLWRAQHGDLPAQTGVIDVGGNTRSASSATAPTGPGPAPVTIDTVSDPTDLTGLSIAISAYLDAWADADEPPVICIHSLSSWLVQADELRVFQFLQSIMGLLREIDAKVHIHMNPEIHDQATINRFSALMDAVIRVEEDGSTTVRRRRRAA